MRASAGISCTARSSLLQVNLWHLFKGGQAHKYKIENTSQDADLQKKKKTQLIPKDDKTCIKHIYVHFLIILPDFCLRKAEFIKPQ